jgi:hypothetical protein
LGLSSEDLSLPEESSLSDRESSLSGLSVRYSGSLSELLGGSSGSFLLDFLLDESLDLRVGDSAGNLLLGRFFLVNFPRNCSCSFLSKCSNSASWAAFSFSSFFSSFARFLTSCSSLITSSCLFCQFWSSWHK